MKKHKIKDLGEDDGDVSSDTELNKIEAELIKGVDELEDKLMSVEMNLVIALN
jgi:hypothetical protein